MSVIPEGLGLISEDCVPQMATVKPNNAVRDDTVTILLAAAGTGTFTKNKARRNLRHSLLLLQIRQEDNKLEISSIFL